MKKIILSLSLLLSLTSIAGESMSNISKQKQFSENISRAIVNLESMRNKITLNELILKTEHNKDTKVATLVEQGVQDEVISIVEDKLNEEIQMYKEISDVNTILDLQIAKLQEAQTSGNYLFGTTRNLANELDHSNGGETLYLLLLTPFAIVIDIAMLPLTLIGSVITGF